MSAFEQLHPALRYHIVSTIGWTDLRPTQADAVAPILAGEDVLLLAPTAGGKTEAAAFPILSRIASEGWRGASVLYICPLKALLNNIAPRLERYASFLGLRAGLWHGDVGAPARQRMLRDPPEILLTTPESLEAMLISVKIDHDALLGGVRAVIVDELHAFAGDDRGWHLRFLLARLERIAGRGIQRIGLSATVGNPEALLAWLSAGRGGRVVGPARPPSDGEVTADYVGSVANAVSVLARIYRGERRLVFADSRSRVEELAGGLREAGIRTFVSHASLSVDERRQAETAFVAEPDCVIVATSTLELGLDVGDLDRVIQVGAPPTVASFLQRMGRTGRRAGALRNLLFLATSDAELLASLAIVSLWRTGSVEAVEAPALPAHIYAQQVMALILQRGGVTRHDLDEWLGEAASAIPVSLQAAIVQHMIAADVLADDDGVLGLGVTAESEFGRRHFGELVAAFTTPLLMQVSHGMADLGTVHPTSLAARPGNGPSILLLSGRSWKVVDIDWPRRRVSVVPTNTGGKSRWLGAGRSMSAAIGRAEELIVAGLDPGCGLSKRASARLAEIRERLSFVDGSSLPLVSDGDGRVTIWLFAGGIASAAVARSLADGGLSLIGSDDVSVTVHARDPEVVGSALANIDASKTRVSLPQDVIGALKFGICLPKDIADAVLMSRLAVPPSLASTLRRCCRLIIEPAE